MIFTKILARNYEKKNDNIWSIRHLNNGMIVPTTHQPSISYWRLSDFYSKSERIEIILFNKTQALGERGGNIALGNKI